jgi:O-antigen/teichoic acid export membrane protein
MAKPNSVVSNTLAQGFGKIGTLIFGLATTAFIYRLLHDSGYGQYVFVTSFLLLFATVADWGTQIITIRETVKTDSALDNLLLTSTILRLILSSGAILLAGAVIRLNPDWAEYVYFVTLFSLVLIALSLKTSAAIVFNCRRVFIWSALIEVINNGLYFFGVLVLLPIFPTLETALRLLIIATFLAALIAWFIALRLTHVRPRFDRAAATKLLKEALPTGALLSVFYIYNRLDIVVLQHFQGNAAVGNYGLAYKVHDNLVQGAAFLMNALFPIFSSGVSRGYFKESYRNAFSLLLASGLVIIIGLLLGAPLVVYLLTGSAIAPIITAMRILCFATAVAYVNHLTGYTLIAIGRQRTSLLIATGALLVNLTGNIIFIPRFSYLASSVMTIVTEGFVLGLSAYFIRRYTGVGLGLVEVPRRLLEILKTRGEVLDERI